MKTIKVSEKHLNDVLNYYKNKFKSDEGYFKFVYNSEKDFYVLNFHDDTQWTPVLKIKTKIKKENKEEEKLKYKITGHEIKVGDRVCLLTQGLRFGRILQVGDQGVYTEVEKDRCLIISEDGRFLRLKSEHFKRVY